jgi:hypothetical protein
VFACRSKSRGVRLPLHIHTREDEQVVVLDGEILVRLGDETHRLTPGATIAADCMTPEAGTTEALTSELCVWLDRLFPAADRGERLNLDNAPRRAQHPRRRPIPGLTPYLASASHAVPGRSPLS